MRSGRSSAAIGRSKTAYTGVMDMIFRDDECRIRTDHAPANFTTLRHMALNLIRKAPGKDSLRLKRKIAAWDDDFLASLAGLADLMGCTLQRILKRPSVGVTTL